MAVLSEKTDAVKLAQIYTTQSQLNANGEVVENLASMTDEEKHTRLTRPVANAYAMSTLVEFEPLIDSTSRAFMDQMNKRFASPKTVCPLDKWLQMYAFDVIGELTFSKRIGFLETGQDVDNMMYHTGQFMKYTGVVGQVPNIDWYFRIHNPILHTLRPTSNILSFTVKQIREHKATPGKARPDFLTRFLEAREKNPDLISEDLVHDYANTNVAGGSDTTAIILRTLFYQISTQKRTGERILSEIKAALKGRKPEVNMDTPITWAEAQDMPYLQACIQESLRWHPATAQILPRIVPKGGVEICGYYLPEGTQVGCNAWTVHRDKELYGQDADDFRPERWLEASEEHARKMRVSIFTFGAGKRACVGKNIALLELSKFVPEVLRRLEIDVINPADYKISSTWLAVQKGLNVNLKLRPQESLLA